MLCISIVRLVDRRKQHMTNWIATKWNERNTIRAMEKKANAHDENKLVHFLLKRSERETRTAACLHKRSSFQHGCICARRIPCHETAKQAGCESVHTPKYVWICACCAHSVLVSHTRRPWLMFTFQRDHGTYFLSRSIHPVVSRFRPFLVGAFGTRHASVGRDMKRWCSIIIVKCQGKQYLSDRWLAPLLDATASPAT